MKMLRQMNSGKTKQDKKTNNNKNRFQSLLIDLENVKKIRKFETESK